MACNTNQNVPVMPLPVLCEEKLEAEGESNAGVSSALPATEIDPSAAEKLPEEMLCKIFKKITKKLLLECRVVSTMWKNTINNNPKLIKQLTFTVTDPQAFLDSELSTKVKSIRFTTPLLQNSEECFEEFFKKIGSSVEQVYVDFQKQLGSQKEISEIRKRQELMFSLLLQHCTKMTELIIGSQDNKNCIVIRGCEDDPRFKLVLSNIQRLTIYATNDYLAEVRQLLLSSPNLHSLALYVHVEDYDEDEVSLVGEGEEDEDTDSDSDDWMDADNFGQFPTRSFHETGVIMEHLQKYNGNLKEISLSSDDASDLREHSRAFIKFFLTLGKLYPNTNFQYKANLNDLCKIEETEDVKVNETTCRSIKSGIFKFVGGPIMSTRRIGLCTNLHSLEIVVNVELDNIKFQPFANTLKKLTYLKIKDEGKKIRNRLLTAEVFAYGIPSLSTLDFDGEGLGTNLLSFHLCFPSLTKLYIRNFTDLLNDDFIYNLAHLDHLKSLTLENLEELADKHLTGSYDVLKDGKMANVPAIAGFQGLRRLHFINCNELTDDSLVNGLALCNGLERITLCCVEGEGKFTKRGINSLQNSKNYIVEDLSFESHGKKHSASQSNKPPVQGAFRDLLRMFNAISEAEEEETENEIVYQSIRFINEG